ncbi:MAG: hypothetical protein H0X66_09595 [Verrucomicrobia bacterium]|nr:hypothetical protein [Verrucomicrobiota bacterium]
MVKFSVQFSVFSFQALHRRVTRSILPAIALILALGGCATQQVVNEQPFSFPQDTFAYANELERHYGFKEDGKWGSWKKTARPDYTLHCFVVARSAKQFFQHARFDESLPIADETTYRTLIRRVVNTNPRKTLPEEEKIIIPGYANLREFSGAHEQLLKEECGGAWQSYLQRGHWRMTFPFSKRNQEKEAARLIAKLRNNHAPVVHIVRFPSLAVNHALLLFDAEENDRTISFSVYDPNTPDAPTVLTFDKAKRSFRLPRNDYFIGGELDVYEVYSSALK